MKRGGIVYLRGMCNLLSPPNKQLEQESVEIRGDRDDRDGKIVYKDIGGVPVGGRLNTLFHLSCKRDCCCQGRDFLAFPHYRRPRHLQDTLELLNMK